jgi:hypothetical protein
MNKNKIGVEESLTKMASDELLEKIVLAMLKMNQDKLKYTETELEEIENKINEVFPAGHKPLNTTLIPFGFYLGELLKRKLGGDAKWVVPDEPNVGIFDAVIEFSTDGVGRMEARPFQRAEKFWKNRDDRMISFIRMICMNAEVKMDKDYWTQRADEDGWVTMAWGDMYRMYIGDRKGNNSKLKGVFHNGTYDGDKR